MCSTPVNASFHRNFHLAKGSRDRYSRKLVKPCRCHQPEYGHGGLSWLLLRRWLLCNSLLQEAGTLVNVANEMSTPGSMAFSHKMFAAMARGGRTRFQTSSTALEGHHEKHFPLCSILQLLSPHNPTPCSLPRNPRRSSSCGKQAVLQQEELFAQANNKRQVALEATIQALSYQRRRSGRDRSSPTLHLTKRPQ
jgi:hypothetical protein